MRVSVLDSSKNNWLGYLVVVLVGGRVSYLRVKSITHKAPLAAQGLVSKPMWWKWGNFQRAKHQFK